MRPMVIALSCAAALMVSSAVRAEAEALARVQGTGGGQRRLAGAELRFGPGAHHTLRRVKCSTVTAVYDFWRLHLIAFLDPAATRGPRRSWWWRAT